MNMKNIFRFIGFLCLAVASIFSWINTIVENKIFDAYVMIPLYAIKQIRVEFLKRFYSFF